MNAFLKSNSARCVLKAWMPIAFEDLDRALLHAEVFVVEMQKQSALFFRTSRK